MSERFIFNKKLNKTPRVWTWLAVAAVTLVAVQANANPAQLVDTDAVSSQTMTLSNIEFQRQVDGAAKTYISIDSEKAKPEFEKSAGQLVVRYPDTKVSAEHLYTLDVVDFATPVTQIETSQKGDDALVSFSVSGPFEWDHQQSGGTLVVVISKQDEEQAGQASVQTDYAGAPITLDFQDVPVRQVLQVIAKVNGFNLVTTDSVSGNVTISLNGVPWDQALDMILKIKGLDKRLEGNILLIAPAEELSAREAQQLQSQQQVAELAPLVSANLQINYAKAANIAAILKSEQGGLLTSRGSVTVDERTNTLLLRDTEASIAEVRSMLKTLDIPVKQVLIESRMVTVRDNISDELGVRWGFTDQQDSDGISGSLEGANTVAGGALPALDNRLNVNLPVNSAAGRFGVSIAKLADGTILDLELSALENENKGEIIASPRITVANQHGAYIEQGTEIPYVQATSSGATSVEYKKAVLSLSVTPHITPDNRIILDLVITQDTRGDTVQTSTGPAVAIDTQEIKTQVLVENGETVVLGGIFQQNATKAVTQVPVLGDIPVVGTLFRNKQNLNEKRELLIFVTPKIIQERR